MNVFRKLPKKIAVAVSGGVDSMAALHILLDKGHDITIAHYVHDSSFSTDELSFVFSVAEDLKLPIILDKQMSSSNTGESKEEYWRIGRYKFFRALNIPVVVGHTLDDAVEWYLFAALNGKIQLMEYEHANVVRPFILQRKQALVDYLVGKNVTWLEDESNADVSFARRNRIRHELLPAALEINPGIYNMVKRMILKKENSKDHA